MIAGRYCIRMPRRKLNRSLIGKSSTRASPAFIVCDPRFQILLDANLGFRLRSRPEYGNARQLF